VSETDGVMESTATPRWDGPRGGRRTTLLRFDPPLSMAQPDNGPAQGAFQDEGATRWKGLWIFGGRPVNSLWITAMTGGTAWRGWSDGGALCQGHGLAAGVSQGTSTGPYRAKLGGLRDNDPQDNTSQCGWFQMRWAGAVWRA
jgi:hypothetical protein